MRDEARRVGEGKKRPAMNEAMPMTRMLRAGAGGRSVGVSFAFYVISISRASSVQ